jgi:hypothetical protein
MTKSRGLFVGGLAALFATTVNGGTTISMQLPPVGTTDPIRGKIATAVGNPWEYKVLVLVSGVPNVYWDKMHNMYITTHPDDPGHAQGAGIPVDERWTWELHHWGSSPYDNTVPIFRALLLPDWFVTTWPEYQVEGIPVPDHLHHAAIAWIELQRNNDGTVSYIGGSEGSGPIPAAAAPVPAPGPFPVSPNDPLGVWRGDGNVAPGDTCCPARLYFIKKSSSNITLDVSHEFLRLHGIENDGTDSASGTDNGQESSAFVRPKRLVIPLDISQLTVRLNRDNCSQVLAGNYEAAAGVPKDSQSAPAEIVRKSSFLRIAGADVYFVNPDGSSIAPASTKTATSFSPSTSKKTAKGMRQTPSPSSASTVATIAYEGNERLEFSSQDDSIDDSPATTTTAPALRRGKTTMTATLDSRPAEDLVVVPGDHLPDSSLLTTDTSEDISAGPADASNASGTGSALNASVAATASTYRLVIATEGKVPLPGNGTTTDGLLIRLASTAQDPAAATADSGLPVNPFLSALAGIRFVTNFPSSSTAAFTMTRYIAMRLIDAETGCRSEPLIMSVTILWSGDIASENGSANGVLSVTSLSYLSTFATLGAFAVALL